MRRIQSEVPALSGLKLVVGLELRGRGDVQPYRVELPGPLITKGAAADARVRLAVSRSHFNELAAKGGVRQWRQAFEQGHASASGQAELLRLIPNVIARQEGRAPVRRAKAPRD